MDAPERSIDFKWGSAEIALSLDEAGSGPSVILLPALSSISTRKEMRPLFDRLAPDFHVSTVDWLGFGDRARPKHDWSPAILSAFLDWLLNEIVPPPHRVVAAGHAATYALYQAANRPGSIDRLVLIAPTWRGPLPTVIGSRRPWFARVRAAIDHPVIGPLLYRLNVNRFVVRKMTREHVYSNPNWLGQNRLAAKLTITRAPGARHASVRFVTGALDRVVTREAFLDLVRRANAPILVIYGDETPPRSRAEMETLAELPKVRVDRLAKGKLGIHEEFADALTGIIKPFLSE